MSNPSNIIMNFPTVIQVSEIENAKALNEKICKGAYGLVKTQPNTKPGSWACNLYTTILSGQCLTDLEPFSVLKTVMEEGVGKFARELKYDVDHYPPQINECWLNVYGKGHSQDIHCHRNHVFSGIYYPKAPEGCGEVVFHSPLADQMLEPPVTEISPLNTSSFRIQPVPGRMLLFRSWLRHSVLPSDIDDDRISIAFNVVM